MSARVSCLAVLLLAACGGGSGDSPPRPPSSSAPPVLPPATTPPTPVVAEITLLFMGNSHTQFNQLTDMVEDMVRTGTPGRTVGSFVAPASLFLEDHLRNPDTMALMRNQNWSFVILQVQKYSSSGLSCTRRRCDLTRRFHRRARVVRRRRGIAISQ